MGGRRERSSFHVVAVERERDMGGGGSGGAMAECFHFDQFYTLSIFFSHHKKMRLVWKVDVLSFENINLPEEFRNLRI